MTKTLLIITACLVLLLPTSPDLHAQEDDPAKWGASFGMRYLSRYNAYGIDLSESSAAALSAGVSHQSGVRFGAGLLRTFGPAGEIQYWSLSAGYERSISEILTLSAEYEHSSYTRDTANVLASLANSISLGADLDFDVISLGVSYDLFLGSSSASYLGFNVSSFHDLGSVYLVPLAQVTWMSQEVEDRLLKDGKGKKGGTGSTSTSITGLSSISLHALTIVPLAEGLNFSIHPYILYSPKSEFSAQRLRLFWSAGLRYSIAF